MTDRRRSPWFAFDSHFFHGPFGTALLKKFGPTGPCLFTAFLCAAKRAPVQGSITFGSEIEALTLAGLDRTQLTDPRGQRVPLDAFWRLLSDHKQITRRRRARLTHVTFTNWEKWQQSFDRQATAERKSRSRHENTGTKGGQNPDDTQQLGVTDSDLDLNSDSDISKPEIEATQNPLSHRMALICKTRDIDAAMRVVGKLRVYVDDKLIEEAIGHAALAKEPPGHPNYFLKVVTAWAKQRGIDIPEDERRHSA